MKLDVAVKKAKKELKSEVITKDRKKLRLITYDITLAHLVSDYMGWDCIEETVKNKTRYLVQCK